MKRIFLFSILLTSFSTMAATKFLIRLNDDKNNKEVLNHVQKWGKASSFSTSFGEFIEVESTTNLLDPKVQEEKFFQEDIKYVQKVVNYRHQVQPYQIDRATLRNESESVSGEQIRAYVNDPKAVDQWALNNDYKKGMDINIMPAWDITRGSDDMVVAVIDTGIDIGHPDLKDSLWVNQAEANGQKGVDDDGNGYIDDIHGYDFVENQGPHSDCRSHGTHCAGIIGATHNSTGVAGVLGKVKLMSLRFLNCKGQGDTVGQIRAFDYAMKMGVRVLNASWGGGEEDNDPAVVEALKVMKEKGIMLIAAAGNYENNNDEVLMLPANIPLDNVISVASMSESGDLSDFSNYGAKSVHVVAPGSAILSTFVFSQYRELWGTSMATPHVSALVALLLSQEPELTPSEIKTRLIETSKRSSKLEGKSVSNGMIDAYRLLLNIRD